VTLKETMEKLAVLDSEFSRRIAQAKVVPIAFYKNYKEKRKALIANIQSKGYK
jgi:hypothetical protein